MTISLRTNPGVRAGALAAMALCSQTWAQTAPALDTVVVTAAREAQPLRTVTADMSVIDRAAIERSGATGVADLLAQVPGVQITRNGGPGQTTSVFLRGMGNQHTAVFVDGVRFNSQELQGGALWAALPLAQIERIEILRGPAAAIYGSDAMGGVVQIFTRQGDGPLRAYAEAGLGNQGTSRLSTGLQGGANGWSYGLHVADERSDGFDVNPGNPWTPNPDRDGYANTSLGLNAGYKHGIHQIDTRLQHNRLKAHYDQSAAPFDDYDRVKNTSGTLRWQAAWSDTYQSVVQLGQARSDIQRFTSSPESNDGRSSNYLLQNQWKLGESRFNIDLERREDRLNTDYAWTQNTDSKRVQNSLSAGWRYASGVHQLDANVRHDRVRDQQNKTTGGLGYGLQLNDSLRWVVSAGTAFRTPTLYERFTGQAAADLKPESSANVETGLHYNAGKQQLSAVAYRNKIKNQITYDFTSSPACNCYRNWESVELKGLTLTSSTRLDRMNLGLSLDFLNPKNLENGKLLPYRSKRMLKLSADTQLAGWTLGTEAQLYSARFVDAENSATLGGYGVVNLYAQHQLGKDWSLLARVNNVADRDYAPTKGYANAGRTLFFSVKWAPAN
ncbi:TonB-dependent receptor [Acidovorax sp. CCYZU-2555]|uniref:TonB-dependent receptor domain-containing protein n=1 Tax=Acidovorax sp. CCYZU-2555 TaxID=2835042 RepID=UPI001BCF8DAA|nr:TonB-dependent receptor [Acidovorax sp. CCYZU-2555]MBS7781531.1 TonB-dependent receptor [Acidovorax sp. CCYZU-2555]